MLFDQDFDPLEILELLCVYSYVYSSCSFLVLFLYRERDRRDAMQWKSQARLAGCIIGCCLGTSDTYNKQTVRKSVGLSVCKSGPCCLVGIFLFRSLPYVVKIKNTTSQVTTLNRNIYLSAESNLQYTWIKWEWKATKRGQHLPPSQPTLDHGKAEQAV